MVNCTFCGNNVTGKKFCPDCGTPVKADNSSSRSSATCPQCNGAVQPGTSFCMHCGTSLLASAPTPPPPPVMRSCPVCHTSVAEESVFCTQCGHDMRNPASAPTGIQCMQCGRQNASGVRFCGGCGSQLVGGASTQSGQYASAPGYQSQYNPQYQQSGQQYQQSGPQYQQSYPQQQYAQGNNQVQPMMGQQPMVLRCPTCMALAPLGSAYCVGCRTSLAGVIPVPMQAQQGQQGGIGGFLQGNGGKYAMGALGGAAAVLGGEMLLNGVENQIENRVEGDMGYGGYNHHHHHRHRDDDNGPLGGLGRLADDIGLI